MEQRKSVQQMVLEKLNIHMQNNNNNKKEASYQQLECRKTVILNRNQETLEFHGLKWV